MKLSFSTLGCPSWSWKEILQFAKNYSFDGIEIRGIQDALSAPSIATVLKEEKQFTKEFLQKNSLSLTNVGSSVSLHNTDAWAESFAEIKQYIQICKEFQIPAIRVFGDKIGEEEPSSVIANVLERLHLLCALSPEIEIYLEVHGDFSTLETMGPIVAEMHEDNFGIIWDVEHSDVVYGDDYEPFYNLLFPKIKHVHIKDRIRNKGLCLIGEGDIPLKDIIHRLLRDGYKGYFSIEWEKRWKKELADPMIALARYSTFMRELSE